MHADLLVTNIGQLATPAGAGPLRGRAMREIMVTHDAAFAVTGGVIQWVGPRTEWSATAAIEVDAKRAALIPSLIDPHTHAVWRGDRLADFEARSEGVGYEQILAMGGGIHTTIRSTTRPDGGDNAEGIAAASQQRVDALVQSGASIIEIKSGYGFTREHELHLLEAIALLRARTPARIEATLLIHVPPAERADRDAYVRMVTDELIPQVSARSLATAVDVFIEREAFTVHDAREIFRAASTYGLAIKAHADQFHTIGGTELALEFGALSVDHLEASGPDQVAAIAASNTIATLLAGASVHLAAAAAPGRALVDAGAIVAVATDLNPGSSPLFSTQLAMALAVRVNRLTVHEALSAATCNAAAALAITNAGRIAVGQRADFLILDSTDWRDAVYQLGANPFARHFIGGKDISA